MTKASKTDNNRTNHRANRRHYYHLKRCQSQLVHKLVEDSNREETGAATLREWLAVRVCKLLDAQACSILLQENDQYDVFLKSTNPHEPPWSYNTSLNSERSRILNDCIQAGDPFFVNQSPDIGDMEIFAPIQNFRPTSILCAPLNAGNTNKGALIVLGNGIKKFTQHDLDLLTRVADVFAQAIFNADTIRKLKVANAELEVKFFQVKNSRNTLRTSFDNIPSSIYIIDTQFTLTAINLPRSERAELHPSILVGHRCYEAFYHREDICPGCRVLETLFDECTTERTRRDWQPDGDAQEWEITSFPILDSDQKVSQAIIMEVDVTEKRRLEATLAQSEKLAAVGQLAAGIAHEINNPLTAIVANAQLLQREIPPEDDRQELVEMISSAGARATQVVRNLLDLARKEQYEFVPTDVNNTVHKAVSLLQHEIVSRSASLKMDLAPDLPEIMASENHLQGVWINLLTNALDSSENGRCEIKVTSRQQGNKIRVTVADNGNGIPPERLTWIFEPFYTTKAPGRGTGLGLSVCHRVIKQHEGHILVDSQVNKGTQFTVVLPIT